MSLDVTVLIIAQLVAGAACVKWYEYEGHCYASPSSYSNYTDCEDSCQALGSYVLELTTWEELLFVQTMIDGSNDQYWVALDYDAATGKYHWRQNGGQPLPSLWLKDEPNTSGYCVRLVTENIMLGGTDPSVNNTYKLGDHLCNSVYRVMCEKLADISQPMTYKNLDVSSTNYCPVESFDTSWRLHCAHKCAINSLCVGFQYVKATSLCTLYEFADSCSISLPSTLSMYFMQDARC